MTGHVSHSLMHSRPVEGVFVWQCDFESERERIKREKMKFAAIDARFLESFI